MASDGLLMKTPSQTYYYGHDQLYSPVVLVDVSRALKDIHLVFREILGTVTY
jgi:hypothetical protein